MYSTYHEYNVFVMTFLEPICYTSASW